MSSGPTRSLQTHERRGRALAEESRCLKAVASAASRPDRREGPPFARLLPARSLPDEGHGRRANHWQERAQQLCWGQMTETDIAQSQSPVQVVLLFQTAPCHPVQEPQEVRLACRSVVPAMQLDVDSQAADPPGGGVRV